MEDWVGKQGEELVLLLFSILLLTNSKPFQGTSYAVCTLFGVDNNVLDIIDDVWLNEGKPGSLVASFRD